MKKSTSRSQRVERTDLYQQVTDRIVAALEKGVPPWRKPWRSVEKYASSPFPVNAATGCHYNGVNIMLLWLAEEEKGYRSNRWLTYKQAQAVGG
ncbi:ArdC family protein, partial [Klebsiella pneumoniae]|nr:ArdC family protein [Klebsiella pneumoniae]